MHPPQPPPPATLTTLPEDCLGAVLAWLPTPADLGAAACTCKTLAAATEGTRGEALWRAVAVRRGWAGDPAARARLGRLADRAAAIGDPAGIAYLAASSACDGRRLPWRGLCRAAAGVACVECGCPTARKTLARPDAPPPLRLCHDCAAAVMGGGGGEFEDGAGVLGGGQVLAPERVAAARLAGCAPSHWPVPAAVDAPPGDPTFTPVRLFKSRAVGAAAAAAERAREAEAAEAADGLQRLKGSRQEVI